MRVQVRAARARRAVHVYELAQAARVQARAAGREKDRPRILRPEARVNETRAHLEPASQSLDARAPERHDPLLSALAQHAGARAAHVDGAEVQAAKLARPQAGAVE